MNLLIVVLLSKEFFLKFFKDLLENSRIRGQLEQSSLLENFSPLRKRGSFFTEKQQGKNRPLIPVKKDHRRPGHIVQG